MKWLSTLGGVSLLFANAAFAGLIDPGLDAILDQTPEDEAVSALFYMVDQVDIQAISADMDTQRASLRQRHEVVVRSLQDLAQATQRGMIAELTMSEAQGRVSDYHAFWIGNIISVVGFPDEIRSLARRRDVDRVYFNYHIELIEPVASKPDGAPASPRSVENGIEAVRAPEVWDMGFTGEGVLVSSLDTGVDGNHPALSSRWRGTADPRYAGHPEWAFFDPVTGWTFPQDGASHGTHTMGTICGGLPGEEIGVAPGAQWIHCAVIDRVDIPRTVADAILSFQWLLDPDLDPSTNWDVPAVCSNSWGVADYHGYPDCDDLFWSYLDACEAAGIVVVFAAGNEGYDGLRRPSDRATDDYRTFSVAAVDAHNPSWPIAGFSSRGPTNCTTDGSWAIKPDIAAPGEDVRSTMPGGGYGDKSGTSMATPHVTGVVALLRQANPDLSVEQVKQIIYDTAFDLGEVGEDNSYGWGMIDAYEAVIKALETVSLSFSFPDGRPEFIDPYGEGAIRVEVHGQAVQPMPGTGMLYYSTGDDYTQIPMVEIEPNIYDAVFPPFDCRLEITYFFSAEVEGGETVYNPYAAPDSTYSGVAASGITFYFQDDFEALQGWTVEDSSGLTGGMWQRGLPAGGGSHGDPRYDADGSYSTGRELREEVRR